MVKFNRVSSVNCPVVGFLVCCQKVDSLAAVPNKVKDEFFGNVLNLNDANKSTLENHFAYKPFVTEHL